MMKKITLVIGQLPLVNEMIGSELNLMLNDTANVVDAINEADKMIASKGTFPLPKYGSLLHMVYNPVENRFYKQVAVTAYKPSGDLLNVRKDPLVELPEGTKVILIPEGICISSWETPIDYQDFIKAIPLT